MAGAYYTVYLQLLLTSTALFGLSTAVEFSGSSETSALRSKQQTKAGDGSPSYGPVACVPGTPQLPNFIQPMPIEPKRILGKWYRYNEWLPGVESLTFNLVNIITIFTNLLNDSLTLSPGSNTPAVAYEQTLAYYDVRQNQCGTGTFGALEYAAVDGQSRGIGIVLGTAAIDTGLILSTDYDTCILTYTCGRYDVSSGICASPDVIVDTRQPANLVSSSTVSAISAAVSRILGPYCLTPDMLPKGIPFVVGLADCPFLPLPTTDCYNSLRDAYRYLGDPNFAN